MLAEAARLFAERGFNKVTVREICVAAKANVASVNYHFGDKAGLYKEIVEHHKCRIEVDATVGTGTTFNIYLPAAA